MLFPMCWAIGVVLVKSKVKMKSQIACGEAGASCGHDAAARMIQDAVTWCEQCFLGRQSLQ